MNRSLIINQLVQYAVSCGFIKSEDRNWAVNRLLEITGQESFELCELPQELPPIQEILDAFCDDAAQHGLLEHNTVTFRDLYDTKLLGALLPPPSVVNQKFRRLYRKSPKLATDEFYRFCKNSNYIRTERIKKDIRWKVQTDYGALDITINLSKPEKDPKAIAAARTAQPAGYPKCLLCPENEGYAGRADAPARQNLRVIPLSIAGEAWGFQYSPYVYYNEHCIVFNRRHIPMTIQPAVFEKLFDFVGQFPHYFIGSNADLPIVGGSILSHEHFQGGNYEFAMAKAPVETAVKFKNYPDVSAGIVKWPMSVLRLCGENRVSLCALAAEILAAWRDYTDESCEIFARTQDTPHNTITPIARMRENKFEMDLVLRNNRTTQEHPLGIFHPHAELHHIKKENIGLIEVMGLAVLPARLKAEMQALGEALVQKREISADKTLAKHAEWAKEILGRYPEITKENVLEILRTEIGKVFLRVLEDCGVYKRTPAGKEGFLRFVKTV